MGSVEEFAEEQTENPSEPLGESAFIVVDKANCLYKPDIESAVRIVPPYGTEVQVVRDEGQWVLVRYAGKNAWSLRSNLSANLMPQRSAEEVGSVPPPNYDFKSPDRWEELLRPQVEYGPRGGRFVRTASGFRRYF